MLEQVGYVLREAVRSLRRQWSTHLVSWLCIALSLLLLAGAVAAWFQLEHLVEAVRAEADISFFVEDDMSALELARLLDEVRGFPGVTGAILVSEAEALERMNTLLGGQRQLLAAFEEMNPFSRFIEISVVPEAAAAVSRAGEQIPGVWGVRANEEVLRGLVNLTVAVRWLGAALGLLVGLITVVLVSHIIKLGIQLRQKEIGVLRLLGASDAFIAAPFYIEGFIVGILGGALATLLAVVCLSFATTFLERGIPFLPWLSPGELQVSLATLLVLFGAAAGCIGSFFGLKHAPS